MGMTAISAYNMSRFTVLSGTGKGAALLGLLGGAFFCSCAV